MIIKIEHDGRSWSYDDDDLTVLQGIAVEEHIGGTLMDYDEGLATGRSACYQALGWLIFHGGDPDTAIASVDFPLLKLSRAWLQVRLAEIAAAKAAAEAAARAAAEEAGAQASPQPGAKPDPTGDPGSGPRSGSTSGSSPRSSATSPPTSTRSASQSSTP